MEIIKTEDGRGTFSINYKFGVIFKKSTLAQEETLNLFINNSSIFSFLYLTYGGLTNLETF